MNSSKTKNRSETSFQQLVSKDTGINILVIIIVCLQVDVKKATPKDQQEGFAGRGGRGAGSQRGGGAGRGELMNIILC